MHEPDPTAVLTRRDTAQDRIDAARILKTYGCRFIRFESRPDGAVAALGFTSEAQNVMPL